MNDLDELLRANRLLFEQDAPEGHLARFEQRMAAHASLSAKAKHLRRRAWLLQIASVAASLLLLVLAARWQQRTESVVALPAEYLEAQEFYAASIQHKMQRLVTTPCLEQSPLLQPILHDLSVLDNGHAYLLQELQANGQQPMVLEQLLNNLRLKDELLDRLLQIIELQC